MSLTFVQQFRISIDLRNLNSHEIRCQSHEVNQINEKPNFSNELKKTHPKIAFNTFIHLIRFMVANLHITPPILKDNSKLFPSK